MRQCDLCGHNETKEVVSVETGRSMGSDRRVIDESLAKVECLNCGLVFAPSLPDEQKLTEHYSNTYTLTQPDHLFVTDRGTIPRSEVFARWIQELCQDALKGSCCEIGAGSGHLIGQLQKLYPEMHFSGIELSGAAVEKAQEQGLDVRQQEKVEGQFDVILSVAVIEHTRSPTEFIQYQMEHLKEGGHLILALPTQDVISNDLFFYDHLYHFASDHLAQFAAKCGFEEVAMQSGHPLMPNYSLHLWRKMGSVQRVAYRYSSTLCHRSASHWLNAFAGLNELLPVLPATTGIFGVNEGYWLAHCYSDLADLGVVAGVDAVLERPEYRDLDFPVIEEKELEEYPITDLLLTLHPQYYEAVSARLKMAKINAHSIF